MLSLSFSAFVSSSVDLDHHMDRNLVPIKMYGRKITKY